MEPIYVPGDNGEASTSVEHRDDRAKYAYHEGAAIARAVLDRLLPALSKDDGDWLYDQIFELHMALYGATLFEVHLTSSDETFTNDDWYSNGWPVLWRSLRDGDTDYAHGLYDDIGEHVPSGTPRMISPPELAREKAEEVAKMIEDVELGEAPPSPWKTLFDMNLKGMLSVRRDEDGRILKDTVGTHGLCVTWELTPAGEALGNELDAMDSNTP